MEARRTKPARHSATIATTTIIRLSVGPDRGIRIAVASGRVVGEVIIEACQLI